MSSVEFRGLPPFEGPDVEAYLAREALDSAAEAFVRQLACDGYAVVDLGPEAGAVCDATVRETDSYFVRDGAVRVQDAWLRSPAVRRLALWPEVIRLLRVAYAREPFPFQTLNFRRGTEQGLHPDSIHFHSVPERFMCGVWVALEDIEPGSGPLVYHPGSHRLPVMTMRDAGVNDPRPGEAQYLNTFVDRYTDVIGRSGLPARHAVIRKGQAFVWAANLAHGGSPVTDPSSTRRSLVTHYYFENCVYYTPMTSDVEAGRLSMRMPLDVRTGLPVWPRRDGRRVFPGVKPFLYAAKQILQRRPTLYGRS